MEIFCGLQDHQVLQRNRKNVSETTIVGQAPLAGVLEVNVARKGRTLPGFRFKPLANVKAGEFTVKLVGIPVGGPYRITLRLVTRTGIEQFQASDVLVGDVWILAGQSNMQGVGRVSDDDRPDPLVRAYSMHDQWAVAKDPIHNLAEAVDSVHTDIDGGICIIRDPKVGVGPGVGFGRSMRRLSGVPQGLIPCAHGGTSMIQWDPDLKHLEGKSLYGATMRRFRRSGSHVAGVVWYQGCGEAYPEGVSAYVDRMKSLVGAFRRDCGNPRLPFIMVQIATVYPTPPVTTEHNHGWDRDWNAIQDLQRRLPGVIRNLTTVPAIDLALEDCIHLCGPDQYRLGRRLAEAAWSLRRGPKAATPPIELKSVKRIIDSTGHMAFEVVFDHVVGRLRAPGRPTGFKLLTDGNREFPAGYRVDLDGNRAVIKTFLSPDYRDSDLSLSYGYGVYAYCNITDEADRSLPAFAPQPVLTDDQPRRMIKTVRISRILAGAGRLEKVRCPRTDDRRLDFQPRTFATTFANLHETLQTKTNDAMVFFAASFACDESMALEIGFGYDGPVKMWIDGKQAYYDPDGINPMIHDQFKVPFNASKGVHEIIVAFGANRGKAWGISLRLYRKDLTQRQLKAGPGKYKLPVLLDQTDSVHGEETATS